MANDLTKNPFIVDTAGATAIFSDALAISTIEWIGATTAGHRAVVKDKDGNVMWESFANGSNFIDRKAFDSYPFSKFQRGLIVDTLGSGKLYITYA